MSENFFQSKIFRTIILSIAGLVVLIFVFGFGVYVGIQRTDFSFKWAEDYHRNFAGPKMGFFGDFTNMENQFPNPNGVFGQIININGNTLTVKETDGDNTEKTILVGDKTTIIMQRKNIKLFDLKVDDKIVVIGNPNGSGQILAQLIRVIPQNSPPKNLNQN